MIKTKMYSGPPVVIVDSCALWWRLYVYVSNHIKKEKKKIPRA